MVGMPPPDFRLDGRVALVSGGLSLYTATRGLSRIRAAERSAAAPRLSVAPMLPVTRAQGAGLSISLTF